MTDTTEINCAILKLFGINPDKVFEVNTKLSADHPPLIHTKSYATELNEDGFSLVQHAQFELVQKKGDGDAIIDRNNEGETE